MTATKPVEKRVRKSSDSGFKTAPDGRLIITESSDEEGAAGGSDAEDIDDLLDALEQGRDSGKVRDWQGKRFWQLVAQMLRILMIFLML